MVAGIKDEDDWTDGSSSDRSEEPSQECEDDRCDGLHLPVWHCVDCDSSYCSDCWPRQGPHKPKKKGRDGVPHEQTNPHIVQKLKGILNPSRNPEEIQRMHEDDESTKWFGVSRDFTGRPSFEDYGRYASLMSSISPVESHGNRYPQLVSFIGVTNAGKSTLIKMLVNHDAENRRATGNTTSFPSPIVGSATNDALPTSGDVHLYADPATHAEQLPILYADCEGFEGGEQTPLGARSRHKSHSDSDQSKGSSFVHSRRIDWANTEEQQQREYAVTALYPRLLYTFSDCVVFVLRNPKTFQSAVLTKLLDWGVSSLEKSINQPALPHCIVALNGTDPSVDDREWDTDFATQSLLSSVKGALDHTEGVPRFRELAEYWRSLGKNIYTVEDLILRYYSSFKVIRIPSKPRYMVINSQIQKLHDTIKNNCEESFRNKRRARMLTNADEMNIYLQSGFDHFTTHLNVPFNFMQISLLRNPIPNDFGGHILQLCTTITTLQPNHQPGRVTWMFEKLSVVLASCVLLDCARFRKGHVDKLFVNYEKFFDYALGEYQELHYPCSYVSPDGTRQCMLVKARHQPKGHQDEKGIIAAGDYQTSFGTAFAKQWKVQLRTAIERIHRDFSYELEEASTYTRQALTEEEVALQIHLDNLNDFFEALGPASSICSHATCFCCLMDVPEHPLPCGHVLCTPCIKAYGKQTKSGMSLDCCPLHTASTKWPQPSIIRFKPNGAGVRILALDGGGIRGIVQLEVLRAIEKVMGGHVPIQSFFDLMVGTGTGGMIALTLAMTGRTVDSCMDMHRAICEHSFQPRLKGIPVISQLVSVFGKGPRYKTKPMHAALKMAFCEEDDLFGYSTQLRNGVRVATTATSVTGRESIVLASYRRPEDLLPAYSFKRPHEPDMELKIWESVAAGLASPNYFRPLNSNGEIFLDGGVRFPNPSFIADRERRLIWPDVADPDLMLSLGTGQNRMSILSKLSEHRSSRSTNGNHNGTQKAKSNGRSSRNHDDILDAELAWLEFRGSVIGDHTSEAIMGRRFIRFNPDLDRDPPASDSHGDIDALQANVRKRLQMPHRLTALRNVAHRLVASSFYFELLSKTPTGDKGVQICHGSISCRLDEESTDLRGLGRILEECATLDDIGQGFEPYFLVRPDRRHPWSGTKVPGIGEEYEVRLFPHIIQNMIHHGVFTVPDVAFPICDITQSTSITLFLSEHDGLEPDGFPISGFPRVLLGNPRPPGSLSNNNSSSDSSAPTSIAASIDSPRPSVDRHKRSQSQFSFRGSSTDEAKHIRNGLPVRAVLNAASPNLGPTYRKPSADLVDPNAGACSDGNSDGGSIRKRTNRFWTYIGNNHMAQYPELYTEEELAKFAIPEKTEKTNVVDVREQKEQSAIEAAVQAAMPDPESIRSLDRWLASLRKDDGVLEPHKKRLMIVTEEV